MDNKNDCIFCKIVRKDKHTDFLFENNNFLAFLDLNQDIKGHTLIISKKHFVNLMDMPTTLGRELLEVIKAVAEDNLKKGSEGFKIVINNFPAAGQVIMHTHVHLLPRKKGDKIGFVV